LRGERIVTTAFERIIDALRANGNHVIQRSDTTASAQCPAHDDHNPSLSINVRPDGKGIMLNCHAAQGCTHIAVLEAVGLTGRDVWDDPAMQNVYKPNQDYRYAKGGVKHRRWPVGSPDKQMYWKKDTPDDSLYQVNRLLAEPGDLPVYVTEGEKGCDAIWAMGFPAVSTGGATRVRTCDLEPLRDRDIIAIVDRDSAGMKWATELRDRLTEISHSGSITFMQCAVDIDKANVVEHFDSGLTLADLVPRYLEPLTPPETPVYLNNGYEVRREREPEVDPAALDFVTTCLADVTPEPVRWLWQQRLPMGKLIMLDGDPSTGKSTLTLFITSMVTNGGTWPDGTQCEYPGDVVLFSAEDGLSDTIRPRLDAAGAVVANIHAVKGIPIGDEGAVRMPDLNDIAPLRRLVERSAHLVIVDVLMAYVPTGNNSHSDQDIRHVMGRLSAMAEQTGCTVLMLRHLNKGEKTDPMYRGGGSIGIIGAARGGMLLARDPDDRNVRILATSKPSNLAPEEPPSLRFRITDTPIGPGIHVGKIEWLGISDYTARQLLATQSDEEIPTGTSVPECKHWLNDYLSGGAKPGAQLKADAKQAGFSERTVQRAGQALSVKYDSEGFPRVTLWSLPHSRANPGNQDQIGGTGATEDDVRKQPQNDGCDATVAPTPECGATGATLPETGFARTARERGGYQAHIGPDRCDECGFHIETQWHRSTCSHHSQSRTEASE
jgi:hypothetical protein